MPTIPGQSAGGSREPRGLVGGLLDRLINKPPAPTPTGVAGVAQASQAAMPPSPAQQLVKQTAPALAKGPLAQPQDLGASLKARTLYALGVRRSDNPAVQAELDNYLQNPPSTPLRSFGQGMLVTGVVNNLLK